MNKWISYSLFAALMLPCSVFAAPRCPPPAPKCASQVKCAPQTIVSCSNPIGVYFGGFVGWIDPYDVSVSQFGTAFYDEMAGGPLAVIAKGIAPGVIKEFGGLHIGYEWMKEVTPGFRLAPAVELEGSYFTNPVKNAHLVNLTERLDHHELDAHEFNLSFPMRVGVLCANGILEFSNDYLSPYLGAGIGAAFISIHGADSAQIDPVEAGVNHFNSDPNDFNTLFAVQAKGGLRYRFLRHYRISAEYRCFYVTSSEFTFGAANYPPHVPTSPWTVKLGGMLYNAATLGVDFLF